VADIGTHSEHLTRFVSGFHLSICGSKVTLEWNQEQPKTLSLCAIAIPEQVIARGHASGISLATECSFC
jgi:hypothetical protein